MTECFVSKLRSGRFLRSCLPVSTESFYRTSNSRAINVDILQGHANIYKVQQSATADADESPTIVQD
jgi:hypothetical protein